jgi:hypothetical protein
MAGPTTLRAIRHPLAPVVESVLQVSHGTPMITLGTDLDATWYPGTWLTDPAGPTLNGLLKFVADEWGVGPHAAAALAFKGYAWAATLPVVVGWAQHQLVPVLDSGRLRIGIARRLPFVRLDVSGVEVRAGAIRSEAGLLDEVRASLVAGHLADVIDALHATTRVGKRLLWGSVAESVASLVLRLPSADPAGSARMLLEQIGDPVADLVDVTDGPDGAAVRRRTCCLWFTGDTGRDTYCTTCCVTPADPE